MECDNLVYEHNMALGTRVFCLSRECLLHFVMQGQVQGPSSQVLSEAARTLRSRMSWSPPGILP